mgnify:CR=1 FL=1
MRFSQIFLTVMFLCGAVFLAPLSQAQVLEAISGDPAPEADESKPEIPSDDLGRRNPRGTILGYIDAVSKGDYEKAGQYFDLREIPKSKRARQGAKLAKILERVLDQKGSLQPGSLLSDGVMGLENDNLDAGVDEAGSFRLGDKTVPVLVEKIEDKEQGAIWLLSSKTLSELPSEVNGAPETFTIVQVLPKILIDNEWHGVPIGHWLAMVLLVVCTYLVAWLVTAVVTATIRLIWRETENQRPAGIIRAFTLPVRLYMAVWMFFLSAQEIGISIIVRQNFSSAMVVVAWVAILLLLWRLIDVFSDLGERRMARRENLGGLSAVMFFRRSIKFVVIAVGIVTILDTVGFDVSTGLAALGIGGLALALGAQKTIENLVGSLTVIFDQPVRVGDFCKVGDIMGTVEQIGMRSTRIRTLDRTLVTIPNGDFSAQNIENYTHRDRFWFHPTLGLRYETSPDQLRYLLVEIRAILYAHPRVDSETARVRFVEFGADSLNIEVYAYVRERDYSNYLEVSEDLNLRIADIVEASGTGFAFPSQTVYLARDAGLSEEKTKAAEAEVQQWREAGTMPLPAFDKSRIDELESTITYPPEGSSAQIKSTDNF